MNVNRLGIAFGAVAASVSAFAQSDPVVLPLEAGVACAFPLTITIVGAPPETREFVDRSGRVVRKIAAGKGSALSFRNATTQAEMSFKPNGSVSHTRINQDGTETVTITGHNVLILFDTDVPAGPSTTQYVGRVVYTVDLKGVFTLQQVSGRSTDICDALS